MIVKLHSDSVFAEDHLVPPCKEGAGDTYLEFMSPMPADDLVEIMGESLRWHIVRTRTSLHQLLTATIVLSYVHPYDRPPCAYVLDVGLCLRQREHVVASRAEAARRSPAKAATSGEAESRHLPHSAPEKLMTCYS